MDKILHNLIFLYGQAEGEKAYKELQEILVKETPHIKNITESAPLFSEKDVTLITYADSFYESSKPTLQTLDTVLTKHLKNTLNTVHVLPFSPFSSDHGFSVIDYKAVKDDFGTWEDLKHIADKYKLMADIVLNHVSAKSVWFQKFLQGDQQYQDYFISFTPEEIPELQENLKKVFRPRSTPLLTPFETANGKRYVWTTFSIDDHIDQIDLNYSNPKVLLEILQVILFMLRQGVRVFRFDAITFIWKELGTTCVHLPQGHAILQIFRKLIEEVCPSAVIITETNVPHKENISYFGDGKEEAHMVYNFALPPLTLHALYTGNAKYLSAWAKTLKPPSKQTTFFNFLACHDGIGILGARGILPDEEIEKLFETIIEHGTKFSYKSMPDGTTAVYEMCATWWSAVSKEEVPFEETIQKFLTSYALCFALAGVPAVYYLSLFGKANDIEAWKKTEHNRDILRTNLEYSWLEDKLADKDSKEAKVFTAMKKLIQERTSHPALHPNALQEILDLDPRIFAILRKSEKETLLALHNVSKDHVTVEFEKKNYELAPYGFLWKTL